MHGTSTAYDVTSTAVRFSWTAPPERRQGFFGGQKAKKGDATSASPGRTNDRTYLSGGGAGPAGAAGVVVEGVGFAVAALTLRPRKGCRPNSESFSDSGPK